MSKVSSVDLPWQHERLPERKKLIKECDPNGNGYCSVAEIDAVFRRKYGFGEGQKMALIKAFDETKNYTGKETGVSADYIEHREFRMFLEALAKRLGQKVDDPFKKSPSQIKEEAPPAPAAQQSAPGFTVDLPWQHERVPERKKLNDECDPNGNGYCSVAEIDAVFRRKYGFGEAQKMALIHAFNETKNYSGKETGVSADYIEKREFRMFLEHLAKKLGMKVDDKKSSSGQKKEEHWLVGAKVGSMKGFITVGGTIVAIPHPRPAKSRSLPDLRPRFNTISESNHKFAEMPHSYCSMDRKPLCPYDPHAQRSRLAIDDAPVPYKNASTIDFHDGIHTVHKNRFKTTHKLAYTGEPQDPRTHGGIIATDHKVKRMLREK